MDLSLEVSNSRNPKTMRIFDTSHYHSDEVVENYLIEVLPVNKTVWLTFNVRKNFSLVLNSSSLQYKRVSNEAGLIDLPDGIYEIKQSYKPNAKTASHYYHLRIVGLSNKICSEMSDLYCNKCNFSKEDFLKNRDKLRDIEEYLTGAKWMVEECNDKVKGKDMYEWARKLLEKYSNECQC